MMRPSGTNYWVREGWGVFCLTLALILIVSVAVANAGWTEGLHCVIPAGLAAFVFAFLSARSRLPASLAPLLSIPVGTALAFRLTAELIPGTADWPQRWAWMWYRIYVFSRTLFSGGSSTDSLVFLFQLCILVWMVAWLITWFVFRGERVWDAVVLAGLLLLGTSYYAPNNLTLHLILFLMIALLLVIRFNLYLRERIWRHIQIPYHAGELVWHFWRVGLALSIVVVALSWLAPAIPMEMRGRALDALRTGWYDLEDRLGHLFATLRFRDSWSADFSGRALPLGGPRQLGSLVVMEVTSPSGAHYWREVAFDHYTGQGWLNSDELVVRFGGNALPLAVIRYQAQMPMTHTVTALLPNMTVLATAGQPVWVSIPARARVNFVQEQLVEGVSYARARRPLRTGEGYVVATLVSHAMVEQLRQSQTIYPGWVYERYLQLPDTLPERVYLLAETITAQAADTVYDKASAVEAYLRQTIAYNEQIAPPPAGRDAVDYLLFESREGYCDYYASAMVVLLRAVGIPARLAAGYAPGERQTDGNTFLVRQKDAHTWPEVFFPEYGWIVFEPTAGRSPIERPRAEETLSLFTEQPPPPEKPESPLPQLSPDTPQPTGDGPSNTSPTAMSAPWLLLGAMLVSVSLVTFIMLRRRRRIAARDASVEVLYARVGWLAKWAGVSLQSWQTPFEQAAAIAAVVPGGQAYVWRLAQLVTYARYAARPLRESERSAAVTAWQRLYPYLVRAALRWHIRRLIGGLIGRRGNTPQPSPNTAG
ncbi:MAG: transglutaminase domain-containing protein [Anaerolineae bacterium]|nr:transglutaminase domain-containing protein [Anaerolineae bacterium]MDW8071272.1 transglutaminase domain-containing protein [Anaerolineae bacterium]